MDTTPDGIHNKTLGIVSLIHKKLLEMLHLLGVHIEHLSLQHDILTPLRRAAEIPEHFIGAETTNGSVNYGRMSSGFQMRREGFPTSFDSENYNRFLFDTAKTNRLRQLQPFCKDNKNGKIAKVNTGVLLPHKVVLKVV